MRTILIGALAALALVSTARAALQDENILLPVPTGFKPAWQGAQGQTTITEYVPASENVGTWSKMITQQIFHGRSNDPPDGLPSTMSASWKSACPGGHAQRLGGGSENGYASTTWSFSCPQNPQTGKPENMWIKVISGADSLYSVQFAVRHDADPQTARSALTYLRKVTVCDTRRPERPCPVGG